MRDPMRSRGVDMAEVETLAVALADDGRHLEAALGAGDADQAAWCRQQRDAADYLRDLATALSAALARVEDAEDLAKAHETRAFFAEQRVRSLEEGLRPFAHFADLVAQSGEDDGDDEEVYDRHDGYALRVGHFRKARALLASAKEDGANVR